MDFESKKLNLHGTEQLLDIWNNPVVKSIIEILNIIFPVGSPIKMLITSGVDQALKDSVNRKQEEVLKELIKSESLTEKDTRDLDFVTSFSKLLLAVNRTTGNEKVMYMTRLFEKSICVEDKEYDFYEECLEKLEHLSKREIIALTLLKKSGLDYSESECVRKEQREKNSQNEIIEDREKYFEYPKRLKEKWNDFIQNASKELECSSAEVTDIVSGLRGNGLCRQFSESTMPIGSEDVYHTTYYFDRMYNQIL